MDEALVMTRLRTLNESELFYRNYRLARFSPSGFEVFLRQIDPEQVRRLNLILPEWPDTIQSEYLDNQFSQFQKKNSLNDIDFDTSDNHE